ncbi:TPX2, C-terminal [Dillenia turbinata]|uniref:TPX2, C-terminal n=1 Tax=Dillenia turbinata TaxID=194707 RepID=A0AAN8VLI8_9MAGN
MKHLPSSDFIIDVFLYLLYDCSMMGMEVTDICMDKEGSSIIVHVTDDSQKLDHQITPSLPHDVEARELINEDTEHQSSEENTETRDYEVKECTNESLVENYELCKVKQEEQDAQHSTLVADSSLEKANSEAQEKNDDKSPTSIVKPATKPSTGSVRTNYTVPQPFALATEKRASSGTRSSGTEPDICAGVNKSIKTNPLQLPNTAKHDQPISHLASSKPLQPHNKKRVEEEDLCSNGSPVSSKPKTKTTVGSAPTFRCTERAEKRKEFYSKLEEKHQALEAEKNQWEARTKEEKEISIKQLRKTLMFKASPMPSFYQEGPPPKVELKKQPPTRARSPKLGRRKSCSDAINSTQGERAKGAFGQGNRRSLGNYKGDITNHCDDDRKDHITALKTDAAHKIKEGHKQLRKTSELIHPKMNGHGNVDITVQS